MASIVSTVTVAYVSKSHKAVQDVDTKAWFHCKSPIFEGIPTGTRLSLTVDSETDKVTSGAILTGGAPAATRAKAVKAADTKAQAAKPAPAPKQATAPLAESVVGTATCSYCGVDRHNSHYAAKQVRAECAERQFLKASATVVDANNPASVMAYALWLAEAPRTVWAGTVKGHEVIGGPATPAPTPPAAKAAAPAKASKPAPKAASKPATLTGGKAATKAADSKVMAATEKMVAESMAGTWDGLLAQQAKNTAGLFKFVTASPMPGAKAHGNWIGAEDATVIAKVVKAEVNDRVRVTLTDVGLVTAFEILGTIAKESGLVKGIEKSGKQQAPAPKGQKADKIVTAGRTARKAATVAVAAAKRAEVAAATLAPAAPAKALTGTVIPAPTKAVKANPKSSTLVTDSKSKAAANKAARLAKLQEAVAAGKAKRG